MEEGAETAVAAVSAAAELDFSLTNLFLIATPTVQATMIILALASVVSWAIAVGKWMGYGRVRREAGMFEAAFWSGQPLDELHERVGEQPRGALERVFSAGMTEWSRSHDRRGGLIPGVHSRVERAMSVALSREAEALESRLSVLATVGATTPFIGLFGTVWGIKTSFEAIALSQNTNLAVVAPGIAEALVATALGLLAAIPAVIFYNKLSGDAERLIARMENFADEFGTILNRQLERTDG